MTANAMKGDRENCLAAGMEDYLTKPLDPEQVLAMIRKWTGRSEWPADPTPGARVLVFGRPQAAGSPRT
ncbi:MAG: hypothetical protein JNL97_00555 [Verrucomicrobiales bacterium]|nr:hypothetical protein [Verrucomicrobiales bacterium]